MGRRNIAGKDYYDDTFGNMCKIIVTILTLA
jgi:hypothetical protein